MYQQFIDLFYSNRNNEKAEKMAAYMKDNFSFLGIQKNNRAQLQKDFIKLAKKQRIIDWDLVFLLWDLPEREFQYLAMDYLVALKNNLQKADISKIEKLRIQKSWWDSVDLLASHLIGTLCTRYPELVGRKIINWAEDDNIWLVRTAVLFQLKYKKDTNKELLSYIINENSCSKEFFITKAIGWALREYSKTSPDWVRAFLECNRLQPLSVREASKYL